MTPGKKKSSWSTIIVQLGMYSIIWWILSDGTLDSLWIGIPSIVLAVAATNVLLPSTPFVWHEFFRFLPYFLLRSLLGGVDVAWRAFQPSLPIAPDTIEYSTKLPTGLPQVFMANTISLLPGTLSAKIDQSVLKIHVLDSRSDFIAEIQAVEQRLLRVFGTTLRNYETGK